MASLISAGVSVTVTDESFYVPATATTVPLFFIATADEKYQPDGVTLAGGTLESNEIRVVTSVKQSVELYGIPRFLSDASGKQLHGDCRNEYGLFALNQYLTVGNYAYVVRADVNLNDNLLDVRDVWDTKVQEAAYVLENLANSYINNFNLANGYTSSSPGYKQTINRSEFSSLQDTAMNLVWSKYTFQTLKEDFNIDHTGAPFNVYAAGYGSSPTGSFIGFDGMLSNWITLGLGAIIASEWTPSEASNSLLLLTNDFKYTTYFLNETRLGANDPARRAAIVTSLAATINQMTLNDLSSESYEFNIVACPRYPEVTDELVALNVAIDQEAIVVGEVPMNLNVEEAVRWADNTYSGRTSQPKAYKGHYDLALYYPHALASNLDGIDVYVPASGLAIRTMAYSDKVAELWFAPAGTRRGVVSGVSDVGYITGELGSPTTFVPVALNKGQRDYMYKYFTNLNPITFFPSRGILVWGQKTQAPDASAMDRVNVVRLMQYIKRSLRKNTMSFVFEPNDKLTRDNIKALVDSFLSSLIVKRGLYDFATVCDESNNTPDSIDRNELYVDVAVKPVRAAEFIYIPIRVVATGAKL